MSLTSGMIFAAITGSTLSAFGIQGHWIVGISVLIGFIGIFWGTGLVTQEEILEALDKEYLKPEEICRVINANRGLGPVDEFNQAGQLFVEITLSNMQHRGAIQGSMNRTCSAGRESIAYSYRLLPTKPECGIDRITGHLRRPHPSA
jgi:hypothetical protein